MDFSSINWLAVLAATVSAFVVGGIWYGPLFGKAWMAEMGFTEEELKEANMAKIYGTAFVLEFIIALQLAFFLGHGDTDPSVGQGAAYGFHIGFFFIALSMGVNALFSRTSLKLWFINGFYFVVLLTLMGVILTVM
ncbi:DUF1761 domain-containing protein [Ekhidna sp.]|jgi:hypothetical protein|uniref:DUF1761 domain-containing protein n=1 Tax=Ekhidna sp. TaxID=2608089 RepID=UPI0032EFE622